MTAKECETLEDAAILYCEERNAAEARNEKITAIDAEIAKLEKEKSELFIVVCCVSPAIDAFERIAWRGSDGS